MPQTNEMLFSLKITDLSRTDNPFIILEDRKLCQEGFILVDELMNGLPWTNSMSKLTLKIEVTYCASLILLRFIHLDKFYKLEYSKIALMIAHNIIQTEYLRVD